MNFVNRVINSGGRFKRIKPLNEDLEKAGLFNPSIFVDGDKIYCSFRSSTYSLYYSENKKFAIGNQYLDYIKPDNSDFIKTTNYICELTDELNVRKCSLVQTDKFDQDPLWKYSGLEDPRLVKWDNKFQLIGVRRDDNDRGQGRIEVSELEMGDQVVVVNRTKLPTPFNIDSYCEKNWMPILDEPNRLVKWSNPTEVVGWNPETNVVWQELYREQDDSIPQIFRGGSQVINFNDKFLTIVHEVEHTEIDNKFTMSYKQRFVEWDQEWNIFRVSNPFRMLGGGIEFVSGMAVHGEDILISFGFQDCMAFILRVPSSVIENFLNKENSYAV